MNKRRMMELIAFLLIMLGICVSVMFVDAFANSLEERKDNSNVVMDECNYIIDQLDDEIEISQPYEDPHESEKIDAALDWNYIYHAEDVGGGVSGNHIDIYFDSHDAAVEFGRQVANVRWYE